MQNARKIIPVVVLSLIGIVEKKHFKNFSKGD